MVYLDKDDIIFINKNTIREHGGNFTPPFNILKDDSLEYVIEAVQAEMFGELLYPEIHDKAAVYMFNIISNHIFLDGNKRTGLEAAISFLKLNNHRLNRSLLQQQLLDFVIKVASGESSLEECQAWFKENIVKL